MNEESLVPRVRVMQIIVFALTMGCSAVLAAMFLLRGANAPQPDVPILTYLSLAFAAAAVMIRIVVPRSIAMVGRKQLMHREEAQTIEPLLQLYQTRLIVGAALLEGAVFFLAVSYLTEGNLLCLAVGAGLTLAVAAHFPSATSVASWITQQQEQMRLERYL